MGVRNKDILAAKGVNDQLFGSEADDILFAGKGVRQLACSRPVLDALLKLRDFC